ncbi:hypothetical protein [Streptomyces sp. MBT33]|uniref:hypothetical protein n=1 Tax=Streptomyces sp. MBT33 TaxID=1488363 RepID=UPI0027DC1EBB|nr:hypothetical protein [Streptomyces sp. MBT33]
MPWFSKRRRDEPASDFRDADVAIELSQADFRILVRVIEHARERMEAVGGSDTDTIRNASGVELLPMLYPRVGTAVARGHAVAMLVSEIRHVEAAVINLESYGGHETVLVEGYALLKRLTALKEWARVAETVDGILTLPRPAPHAPCG